MLNLTFSPECYQIDILSRVRHKNLVALLGYCQEKKYYILIYEYMKNGSLYDYLHGISLLFLVLNPDSVHPTKMREKNRPDCECVIEPRRSVFEAVYFSKVVVGVPMTMQEMHRGLACLTGRCACKLVLT